MLDCTKKSFVFLWL